MSQRFSNADLAAQIRLARNACRRIKAEPERSADLVSPLLDILDRIVAETSSIEALRDAAATALGKVTGAAAGGGYEDAAGRLLDRLDMGDPGASDTLAGIIRAEHEFWAGCEKAIQGEIAQSSAVAAQETISSAAMIDTVRLADFINSRIAGEGAVRVTGAKVASEGFSKLTLFVGLEGNRTLPDELVIRMDKAFNYLGTTVTDEYSTIELLYRSGVPVPQPFAVEETGDVLGGPFLLVSRCAGANVGRPFVPPGASRAAVASVAAGLGAIHAVEVPAGVRIGADRTDTRPYIYHELDSYEAKWRETGGVCPALDAALAWARQNVDSAIGAEAIVHNDFNFHNLLIDGDRVTGVVDWEFVHIGNPAADIGYLRSAIDLGIGLDAFLDDYVAAGGRRPSQQEIDFYTLWGHLRLAIMSFQTEKGFREGRFEDPRYGLAGVHFMRKPILGVTTTLSHILEREKVVVA